MVLEIKHIAPYSPFDVKVITSFNGIRYNKPRVLNGSDFNIIKKGGAFHKLVLRNLSDLTKEIEHKGEKFIPIEKLFDIETGLNWSASDYIKSVKGKDEFWVRKNENGRSFSFGYNSENKYFYYVDADGLNMSVKKQFELFQKLFEWHFDVFGLIEQGLAVDINTLEK